MVYIYLNYPNPRATLHSDLNCGFVPKPPSKGQRWIRVTPATFEQELAKFRDHEYVFRSEAKFNDMWLEVDFGDKEFERAVGDYLLRVLSTQYTPFSRVVVREHC